MKQHHPARICVSVAAPSVAEAVRIAREAEPLADVIEIRLDALAAPEIPPFLEEVRTPLLFTNRPAWEGGGFAGDETARVAPLLAALAAGAAYVDIELNAEPALRDQVLAAARAHGGQVIVSWHDFKVTPSAQAIATILQEQYRSGAHIGKIVTTARDFRDVLRVLALQDEAAEMEFPLIAFCMGRPGMISRVATLELNGFMTYAAPDHGAATAPGQLSASVLRRLLADLTP
ncbi:MAG: type I 3-dehydroquinate dehydratase [Desulfobacteraceae bacterium]|nr:type I 3-dehydroquinate dehydratase [Desulfobacteraceae bacterium]